MTSPKYINRHRSDSIIEWIKTHPLISRSALCAMTEYEDLDLRKVEECKKAISAKYLDAFERELKHHGYTPLHFNNSYLKTTLVVLSN